MEIKLSILIATMPRRKECFAKLLACLSPQYFPFENTVEVIADDSMNYNIGIKRNKLLAQAVGEYVVFIDDDDHISNFYISKIITATETTPDCIGISGTITTNGGAHRQWYISKEFGHWFEANGVYFRTPNHISPVRRELALQAGFPEIAFGEDAEYSKKLLPLLKTEVVIPGNIYHYDYVTKK